MFVYVCFIIWTMSAFRKNTTTFTFFILSIFGATLGEECFISNQRRGVCTTRSNCPSLSFTEEQPVLCHSQGGITYVCCELIESESDYFRNEDAKETANIEDEEVENEEDRIYNFNRNRNRWNQEIKRNNYSKKRGEQSGQYIQDSTGRGNSNIYFETSKQPVRWQNGDASNTFYYQNDKNTFNGNYQNHKAQGNEWSQRPQFSGNGNSNGGWQENQYYYGSYDNRRTTERPRTTTSRVSPSNGFRPNLRPDFNRPQNFNTGGNRPQTSFTYENKPFSGHNSPQNYGENNPENPSFGGNRPQNPTFGTNRPQNSKPNKNRPQGQHFNGKSISELKCDEYSEPVRVKVSGLPLTLGAKPITVNVDKCVSAHTLIVGGQNTTIGEFPHMAAIGYNDKRERKIQWLCGGSLISDQFVLTAAHCITTERTPVKVRLGEHNLLKVNDGAYPEDYSIAEIIKHPDFRPPSKYNDIALLRLSRRVQLKKHIRPACLHTEHDIPEPKVLAIGWGRTDSDQDTSEVLLKVALNVIDKNKCSEIYSGMVNHKLRYGIIDSQVCAGELSGGKDTCQGDSGGPLEITSKTNRCIHYIVGVTSFGKRCAIKDSAGVYTRVSSYVPWIESIVWPQ